MGVSLTGESANSWGSATEVSQLWVSQLIIGESVEGYTHQASLQQLAVSSESATASGEIQILEASHKQLRSAS
jgi:hypothetical protein